MLFFWLIPLIVVAVLVLRFGTSTHLQLSPCIVKTKTELCPDDTPGSLTDEDETEPEPVGLMPNVSMPFTGHHILEGQAVPRLRSRVLYETPLLNPLLLFNVDGTPTTLLASRLS